MENKVVYRFLRMAKCQNYLLKKWKCKVEQLNIIMNVSPFEELEI